MPEEKKCCGFDPYPRKATLLGLLTLAYPAFLLASFSVPLLLPFGSGERRPACRAAACARALLKLMNGSLLPGFRTAGSARLFKLSPAAAGLVFKYLNVLVLTLAWVMIIFMLGKLI